MKDKEVEENLLRGWAIRRRLIDENKSFDDFVTIGEVLEILKKLEEVKQNET